LRKLLILLAAVALASTSARAETWDEVLAKARGQTVYWNAWGGSQETNDYIAWAAGRMKERFGVAVEHVKLTDTADAVARVLAEKSAGRTADGSIDLIWINGENFAR
jgi:putative thiamine transport system substrate-binding protein